MGRFVAIGGGENGHHNTKYETAPFDKEIIRLTGKTNPNFLFIGLANSYPDYYFEIMDGIYAGMYSCKPIICDMMILKIKILQALKLKMPILFMSAAEIQLN